VSIPAVPRASGPVLKFYAPGLIFGSPAGVVSHFNVLRSLTRFRQYQGRPVPFSCVHAPGLVFSVVPRASAPIFMFCTPGLVFDGTKGIGSCFQVFGDLTCFLRYRRCQVPFSCFARLDLFSAVPRTSGLVFKFWAPGHVFCGTEGVGSRFHVLCSLTHFRRYRGR
jgi:hypothetical protein